MNDINIARFLKPLDFVQENSKRRINYLRISLTDRCNLKCVYCMPECGIITKSPKEILTFEEITRLVRIFASLGINKVRLTGGEPLVRKGVVTLVRLLSDIEGIEEVSLTTNGVLLSLYAAQLKQAGLKRINVSLDSLKEAKFGQITRNNCFPQVLEGIEAAKEAGFETIKLNVVVMKGINDGEIYDFVDFALNKGLVLRFIEFMNITPLWRKEYFIPIEEVERICKKRFRLQRVETSGPGPAVYCKVENDGLVGFIHTNEYNCRKCSRLRLTSEGRLKMCLYEDGGISLKQMLRSGLSDSEIKNRIEEKLKVKEYTDYRDFKSTKVYMSSIGG